MDNPNILFSKNDLSPSVKFLLPNMTSPSPIQVPGDSSRFSSATKSRSSNMFNQTLNRSTFNPILTPKGDRGADRKSTRLNSSHLDLSRMPSSA